jgi:hypothetical protein
MLQTFLSAFDSAEMYSIEQFPTCATASSLRENDFLTNLGQEKRTEQS